MQASQKILIAEPDIQSQLIKTWTGSKYSKQNGVEETLVSFDAIHLNLSDHQYIFRKGHIKVSINHSSNKI